MTVPYFTPEQLEHLETELTQLNEKYQKLLIRFTNLKFENEEAAEYAVHGFARRINTLRRCVENVFVLCPPDIIGKPSDEDRKDTEINLQSFVFNVFGCIDNLAWIWAKELGLKDKKGNSLSASKIGFMSSEKNEIIKRSFSIDFQRYLENLSEWYGNLENFRHALAHRIPLYIPPFQISPDDAKTSKILDKEIGKALRLQDFSLYEKLRTQQGALGKFIPLMLHSYTQDGRWIVFHAQVLADWNTIVEMSEKFLEELDIHKKSLNSKVA